ncbi:MAG: superoxide dismutase [Nanoarchaeota archaeon]|nr:superoxide dismutase [Nanoarchaeota archaeon]
MMFNLPKLPYAYDALEPFIDARTMEIHHGKHHQTYVDKLNKALEKYPKLQKNSAEDLIKNLNVIPEDIRTAVRNHGGGHVNHSFFWQILKKGIEPKGEILRAINKKWGIDTFREQFKDAATTLFGSGWAWLVVNSQGELEIMKTPNQDSPITNNMVPILGIDVWEHSYYLKYQNRRNEYVDAFFQVINWEKVNENYLKARK